MNVCIFKTLGTICIVPDSGRMDKDITDWCLSTTSIGGKKFKNHYFISNWQIKLIHFIPKFDRLLSFSALASALMWTELARSPKWVLYKTQSLTHWFLYRIPSSAMNDFCIEIGYWQQLSLNIILDLSWLNKLVARWFVVSPQSPRLQVQALFPSLCYFIVWFFQF